MKTKLKNLIFLLILAAIAITFFKRFHTLLSSKRVYHRSIQQQQVDFPIEYNFESKNKKLHKIPVNQKNYVYIDLGVGNGDSVYVFFEIKYRESSGKFSKNVSISDIRQHDWIIHAFEANPIFTQNLYRMKERISSLGHKVHLYNSTAAWIYDGKIDFYLDTINSGHDYWGSSLNKNHPDVLASIKKNK
jgi:hypothetical protein